MYHIPWECKSRIWLMLKSVKQCSVRYKAALGENKQKQTEKKKKREERKRIIKKLNEGTAALKFC